MKITIALNKNNDYSIFQSVVVTDIGQSLQSYH